MESKALEVRQKRQLRRLEMLMDVVFALLIWRVFINLPSPGKEDWSWVNTMAFVSENAGGFAVVFIGMVLITIYWLQNNTLFGNLEKTDTRHTTLSLFQLLALLLYLYSVRLGLTFPDDAGALAMQSLSLALAGFLAGAAWKYASGDRRLVSDDLSEAGIQSLSTRTLAEPVSAIITLPFAFVGPVVWELSWLVYPLARYVFGKRSKP